MGTVTVRIAGRSYDLACDDGQENRLAALASQVDREAQDLSRQLGAMGETRVLAMAALMLADRLDEAVGAAADPQAAEAAALEAQRALDAVAAERDAAVETAQRLREERDAALAACEKALAERDAVSAEGARQASLFDDAALARLDDASDRLERALDNADAASDR